MLRMDDAASVSSSLSSASFIPETMKFWHQMVPWASPRYMFSRHWAPLEGEPDDLTATVGDVGIWQVVVVILMMMFNIPTVFHIASPEVSTTNHDFWCHRLNKNLTVEQWKELSKVEEYNFRGKLVLDPCHIKDLPYQTAPYDDLKYMASAGNIPCHAWDYNSSRVSVVSQFNLACQRLPVNNVAESVFSLGAAVGGLFTGYLADRIGRKKVLMASQGIVVVLGFLNANAKSYSGYLLARTILGAACSSVLQSSLLMCMEITGGKWRDILTTIYMASYSLGYVILHLFNRLFINWIYLQYSITLLAIFLLSIWWLVPESPRWCLTSQNLPRLMLILETASSFNRRALAPGTSTKMKNLAPMIVEHQKPTIGMLFRGPAHRRLSIVAPFINFFCALTYYGLVLNQDLFNYGLLISGVVEFFAEAVVLLLGIRNDVKMVMVTNALSGLSCLIAAGLTKSVYFDVTCTAARLGGGMMNSCLSSILASMYPTQIRAMSVGWSFFFTNVGIAAAANIVLLSDVSEYLPLIILGLSGLLGSLSMLFLPGRVSRDLLDLSEEVEYGHRIISSQQAKDPNVILVPPVWRPDLEDNEVEAPSGSNPIVTPSAESKSNVKKELSEVRSGWGVAGYIDPDQYVPKAKARSPVGHTKKKKNVRMDKHGPAERTQEEPSPQKQRRWYFFFLC